MLTAVVLSAALSAVVAIAVTLVIERWGGRIGGVLGTLPTTIVPAGIGLALASNAEALAASLAVVPYGMLMNGCFLLVYVFLPPRLSGQGGGALALTTTSALLVWGVFGALVLFALDPLLLRVDPASVALVGTVALGGMGLMAARGPRPAPSGHRSPGALEIMSRGLAAGAAIGLAVFVAGTGCAFGSGRSDVAWFHECGGLCLPGHVVPSDPRRVVGFGRGMVPFGRGVDPALLMVGHAVGFNARSHNPGSGTPVMRSSTALIPRTDNSASRRASRS
jgi:hypothetical protein